MKEGLKYALKSMAVQLPVYAGFVTVYIMIVLKFLGVRLEIWFKEDRRIYAAVALGLIIGQGFVLEAVTRFMERSLTKKPRR